MKIIKKKFDIPETYLLRGISKYISYDCFRLILKKKWTIDILDNAAGSYEAYRTGLVEYINQFISEEDYTIAEETEDYETLLKYVGVITKDFAREYDALLQDLAQFKRVSRILKDYYPKNYVQDRRRLFRGFFRDNYRLSIRNKLDMLLEKKPHTFDELTAYFPKVVLNVLLLKKAEPDYKIENGFFVSRETPASKQEFYDF